VHVLVTLPGAAGDEILATDAWIGGAVGVEELGDDLRVAFADTEAAETFAAATGGTATMVADDAGLDSWQAHAESWVAGPFTIRPPWLDRTATRELVIDPGRAFGSGSHASTRLAVELLVDCLGGPTTAPAEAHIADIGCGSGILAITAATLGATCVAVDIDPAAVDATTENATTNGVADCVEARSGSTSEAAGTYDLAVVNVTIDIHESIATEFRRHLSTGSVIVAGLLAGPQEERAAHAYRARIVQRRRQGEWAALLLDLNDAFPDNS